MPCFEKSEPVFHGPADPQKVIKCVEAYKNKLPPFLRRQLVQKKKEKSKKVVTKDATYFNIYGQSWESKGFAILEESDVDRMRIKIPITQEETEAEAIRIKEEKRRMNAETEKWRKYFQVIDDARKAREEQEKEVDVVAEEERAKREALLEKALMAKHEQDEVVKKATKAIREAKCQAMWTQQMDDQKAIVKVNIQHEIEKDRKNAQYLDGKYGSLDDIDRKKAEVRVQIGKAVQKQMEDRRKIKFMETERNFLEGESVREALRELEAEKKVELQRLRNLKLSYRNELNNITDIKKDFERMMWEQELEDERRNYKFLKAVELRNANIKAEKDKAAKELQDKQKLLLEMQQKVMSLAKARDELRYLSEREQVERKYREQERAAVEKRARTIAEMHEACEQQRRKVEELKACYLMQHEKELRNQIQMIRTQQDEVQQKKDSLQEKKTKLRTAVANQIRERELKRRHDAEQSRFDTAFAREQDEKREHDIQTVLQIKLDGIRRQQCLPPTNMDRLEVRVKSLQNRRQS